MKTPDIYNKLIERHVITTEIAADVIYSLNKRAKNWRDRHPDKYREIRELRISGEHNIAPLVNKYRVLDYYRNKDYIIISLFRPEKIHIIKGIEYLYYRVYKSIFHLPGYIYISYGLNFNFNLPVEKAESFPTPGEDVAKLVSLPFCNKVINLIKSGDFILIDGHTVLQPNLNVSYNRRIFTNSGKK
jgi:hypothetical protein